MTKAPNPYGERANYLREVSPALIADLHLYPAEEGGRTHPSYLGWCVPCFVEKTGPKKGLEGFKNPPMGYTCCPLLGDEPMEPGEQRRVGFVFLAEESAEAVRRAGHFYLWDGRFVGEAHVISD